MFDGDFQILDARIVGGRHLKMRLKMAEGADEPIEAIAFGYVGGVDEDPRLRSGPACGSPIASR